MSQKITPAVKKQLENAVKVQAQGKEMEKEGKALQESAKEVIMPLFIAYDLKDCPVIGLGKTVMKVSKGSTIVEAKLRENLLLNGMGIEQVNSIVADSQKTWEKPYLEFVPEKK